MQSGIVSPDCAALAILRLLSASIKERHDAGHGHGAIITRVGEARIRVNEMDAAFHNGVRANGRPTNHVRRNLDAEGLPIDSRQADVKAMIAQKPRPRS